MRQDPSWEDLANELRKIRTGGEPLRADWSAFVGSEGYGIWHLGPYGSDSDEARATFSLIAAHVIEKLGIPPIPTPKPSEYFPHWEEYCAAREELEQLAGNPIDRSDTVPYGLGDIDLDAVDPCTRAWLEVLRRDGAIRVGSGSTTFKGTTYPSVHRTIRDVCAVSAAYCTRRARDEIGERLLRQAHGVARDPVSAEQLKTDAAVDPDQPSDKVVFVPGTRDGLRQDMPARLDFRLVQAAAQQSVGISESLSAALASFDWSALAGRIEALRAGGAAVEEAVGMAVPFAPRNRGEALDFVLRFSTSPTGLGLSSDELDGMTPEEWLARYRDWESASTRRISTTNTMVIKRRAGRPSEEQTLQIYSAWVSLGKPEVSAAVCDKIARKFFPDELQRVEVGSPGHKKIRERVRQAIKRSRRAAAT